MFYNLHYPDICLSAQEKHDQKPGMEVFPC